MLHVPPHALNGICLRVIKQILRGAGWVRTGGRTQRPDPQRGMCRSRFSDHAILQRGDRKLAETVDQRRALLHFKLSVSAQAHSAREDVYEHDVRLVRVVTVPDFTGSAAMAYFREASLITCGLTTVSTSFLSLLTPNLAPRKGCRVVAVRIIGTCGAPIHRPTA